MAISIAACRTTVVPPPGENRTPAVRVAVEAHAPVRLSGSSPVLPPAARRAGRRGPVLLEVRVDETGAVTVQKVVRGHALLDDEAIPAVRQWRYAPFVLDGRPTPLVQTVLVNFVNR
jgi:periplasmic protein TonB